MYTFISFSAVMQNYMLYFFMCSSIYLVCRDIEYKVLERKMVLLSQLADLSHPKQTYLEQRIRDMEDKKSQLYEINESLNQVLHKVMTIYFLVF